MKRILDILAGISMMVGAYLGMILLVAGICLAIATPGILIVWMVLKLT